jgi:GTP-binding protein HflX
LLHVVDCASAERDRHIAAVEDVLAEVGTTAPVLLVYNKLDLLPGRQPRIDRDDSGRPLAVWVSARDDAGLDLLAAAIAECLGPQRFDGWLHLPAVRARLRARLFAAGAVLSEEVAGEQGGSRVHLRLPQRELELLLQREGVTLAELQGAA